MLVLLSISVIFILSLFFVVVFHQCAKARATPNPPRAMRVNNISRSRRSGRIGRYGRSGNHSGGGSVEWGAMPAAASVVVLLSRLRRRRRFGVSGAGTTGGRAVVLRGKVLLGRSAKRRHVRAHAWHNVSPALTSGHGVCGGAANHRLRP